MKPIATDTYNFEGLITDSRHIHYSDQPFMAYREKALELLEWADAHKNGSRTLNGRPVPEIIINGRSWRKRKMRIAVTDGVFAHARYDDSFRPCHEKLKSQIVQD